MESPKRRGQWGHGLSVHPEDRCEAVHLPWDGGRYPPDRHRACQRDQAAHRRPGDPLRAGGPQRPAQREAVYGSGPDGTGGSVLHPYPGSGSGLSG